MSDILKGPGLDKASVIPFLLDLILLLSRLSGYFGEEWSLDFFSDCRYVGRSESIEKGRRYSGALG